MALTSPLFASNARLQAAARNAPPMRLREPNQDAVRKLQEALNKLGYPMPRSKRADGFDGVYGQETYATVARFQREKGLSPDGEAGRDTLTRLDALVRAGGGAPPSPAPAPMNDPKALAELMKPMVLLWVANSLRAIGAYEQQLKTGLPDLLGINKVTVDALEVHFHLSKSGSGPLVPLATIRNTFSKVVNVLGASATVFRSVDAPSAAADFQKQGDASFVPPPAYVLGSGPRRGIYFTPSFKTPRVNNSGFGPNCLTAMVLHECIHYVDANAPDHAYEHQPAYDTLPTEKAIHNPSSYASFAGHVTKGFDKPRYGAGTPSL